jgi:hypothetical protein
LNHGYTDFTDENQTRVCPSSVKNRVIRGSGALKHFRRERDGCIDQRCADDDEEFGDAREEIEDRGDCADAGSDDRDRGELQDRGDPVVELIVHIGQAVVRRADQGVGGDGEVVKGLGDVAQHMDQIKHGELLF